MKKTAIMICALLTALCFVLVFAGCGGGGASDGTAGTYKGLWYKFVGDTDDNKVENEEFSLVLDSNGKGKFNRDGYEYNVTWKLDGENFTMTETFLGISLDYTGTLKDGHLELYNGDPEAALTCMYVFEK